jgi:hypothetical protein
MGNEFKQSGCVNFVQLLKQVRIRGHNKNEKSKENYLTTYNGFEKVSCFTNKLHKQMQLCQSELLHLPLTQPKRDGRGDYIVILYKNLLEAKTIVEAPKLEETLMKKFPYIYCGNEDRLKRFPAKFSKEKHPSNIDYQNHKVHFMFNHHKKVISHIINRIKFLSFDNELLNTLILTTPYVSTEQNTIRESEAPPIYRYKTSLSVNQLAYFFDLIMEVISNEPVNKKELAQLLSELFETPYSKQPSSQQIYKAFYKVDDVSKRIVKDTILKIRKNLK